MPGGAEIALWDLVARADAEMIAAKRAKKAGRDGGLHGDPALASVDGMDDHGPLVSETTLAACGRLRDARVRTFEGFPGGGHFRSGEFAVGRP